MITSSTNQHVKQVIQWQAKSKERARSGIFLVEGPKMFLEAPKGWIKQVYLSESFAGKGNGSPLLDSIWEKLKGCSYELVSDELFTKMSDTQTPQGILTVLSRPSYSLDDMIQTKDRTPLLVVLEDLQDPGNLGTIMRTSEGAGVTGVILSKGCVDLFNPKVVRATMGSIYRMPFLYTEDLHGVIRLLHEKKITSFAAHLNGTLSYNHCDFQGPCAFLIGNEGNGLKKETADLASSYLRIPMEGQLESLNAAVATALLIYEAHRQRSELH